jgi:hypothetical protein
MEATINIKNVVTADKVQIIGETYSDYQLPTNCIDFHLAEQGFINFVAGTYFTNNNSFFSLHKIERSEDQKTITAIKEIKSIYGYVKNDNLDVNAPYYYTYTDGSADPNRPDDYSVVFDSEWITSPKGLTKNTAYYFEVPVYAGEYALGSAGEKKIGAYLVYLDLAANAQIIERTKEYEEIYEETSGGDIPDGVELLDPNDKTNGTYNTSDIDPMGSAFITITPNASGEITFDRVGDTVTHSAKDGTAAEFIGADLILKDGNGHTVTMPSVKTKIERTTYRDYNINTRVSTVTVITKTTVTEGQTETVTYTKQTTATDADGNVIADKSYDAKEVSAKDAVPDTKATGDGDDQTLTAGSKLIDLAFAYGQGDNVTIAYLYTPAVKDESDAVTSPATYLITITNKSAKDINMKAILTTDATASGITFIISDGTTQTTLDNATDAQTVTIKSAGTAEGA